MVIRNISITNFQSYFETQSLEFDKGLNLILGKGGKGKSKLFNAFYWVFFGKIYISDIGWRATNGLPNNANFVLQRHELFNKKALYDAKVGDEITLSVTLELEDDKGVIYNIERSAVATRLDFPEWDNANAWRVSDNMLKVIFEGPTGTVIRNNDLAEDQISVLFPESIRDYIWFQGESLDSLINFRKKETLRDAVKHISYYPYYEKLSTIIALAKAKIVSLESKHLKEKNKHNTQVTQLITTEEYLRTHINSETKKKQQLEENVAMIEVALAQDETKLSGMASFTGLVAQYKTEENNLRAINDELTHLDERQRSRLPTLWVLRGTQGLIQRAKGIIEMHVESEYTAPEKKYLDNPGKAKLEEILRDGVCYVCGSKVDAEHQHAIDYIRERLRLQEEYLQEMEDFKANLEISKRFNMFIGRIQDYPDTLLLPIGRIDKEFEETENAIEKLVSKRKRVNEKLRDLDAKIAEVKKKYGVDPVQQASTASLIKNSINASRGNLQNLRRQLSACEKTITDLNNQLKQISKELASLGAKDSNVNSVEETQWKNLSLFLEDICARVQEKARKKLLEQIQERANQFYARFTEHDNGYRGKVEIGNDYSIAFDAGLNTSHEDRKKMSIINALLSLNQDAIGTFYPFISDAPTSSFDPETTHKYLRGIKDIFHQTIIITKDVEEGSDNYNDLYNESNVSRIYTLSSKIHGSVKGDLGIHEVSTQIERKK